MAENQIMDNPGVYRLNVAVSYPTTPTSGEPVRWGEFTGVALTNEGEGGQVAATDTSVDFGPGMWDLSCKGEDDGGNDAIAVGDALYFNDTAEPRINKKVTGTRFFGFAAEALGSGSTGTIHVIHVPIGPPVTVTPASLSGTSVGTVAESDVIGGIPLVFMIPIADAASSNVEVTMTHKVRVLDAYAIKKAGAGAASNTITVGAGASAITNAIDMNVADTVLVRAGQINDANYEIAAAGALRVTWVKSGGNAAALVVVTAVRVA